MELAGPSLALANPMGARHFTELIAWQLAAQLREQIVAITARPAVSRHRRYCDQVEDAVSSGCSNVAEGFARYEHADFARYLSYSLASLNEVQDRLDEARVRHFVTEEEFGALWHLSVRAIRAVTELRRSLRRSDAPPSPHRPPRPRSAPPSRGRHNHSARRTGTPNSRPASGTNNTRDAREKGDAPNAPDASTADAPSAPDRTRPPNRT
jgi:four helix bundle protein